MKIDQEIEKRKRELATTMNSLCEQLPDKTKKGALLLIGTLATGFCLYIILQPFLVRTESDIVPKGKMPIVIITPAPDPLLTEQDKQLLVAFIHTMDSIKQYDTQTYENAMVGHKGLIDSILFLLNMSGQSLLQK